VSRPEQRALGIGLVGGGRHGSRYANHLSRDVEYGRLVALARRDETAGRAQAAGLGARYHADPATLVADPEVEAVVAVVPPHLHPAIVEAAAAVGKPVLLEKPVAVSLAAGERLREAARRGGIRVMVAQTMRYNEVVRTVRGEMGRIGPLHALHIDFRFEPSPLPWVTDPEVAFRGNVLHTGIHSLDLVRYLSGREGERVSCEVTSAGGGALDDNFAAVIRLEGGVLASVTGCRATQSRSGAIAVTGRDGQIVADHVLRRAEILKGKEVERLPLPPPVPTVRDVARDFVAAVREGRPMPIPLEEGLRALALVEGCYRSVEAGKAVPVPVP
jgi:predicted dehydrogenase